MTPTQSKTQMEDTSCIWEAAPAVTPDQLEELNQKMKRQKYGVWALLLFINVTFISTYLVWPSSRFHHFVANSMTYINTFMMFRITFNSARDYMFPKTASQEEVVTPKTPESLAILMTCYDETEQEIKNSLDSLVTQAGLKKHRQAMFVVCDGKKRKGAGMQKTTAEILEHDVFVNRTPKKTIKNAYMGWRRRHVDVDIFTGTYANMPFCCIIKHENQAKRDSLIMVRSFLLKHNSRHERPRTIFNPETFNTLSTWLFEAAKIDVVDHIIGIDADTVFHPSCIKYMVEEARRPQTTAVLGYMEVNFNSRKIPSFWDILQNSQYFVRQRALRVYQSTITERCTCLAGCCHLLKVCETNCGDEVLLGPFGYYPGPKDNLWRHLIAKVGEDRHHASLVHSRKPEAKMRMAEKAIAYTNVPQSLSAYLNQRRRWSSSAVCNELLMLFGPHTHLFERVFAAFLLVYWALFVSLFICKWVPFIPGFNSTPSRKSTSWALTMVYRVYYLCLLVGVPLPMWSRLYISLGMVFGNYIGVYIKAIHMTYTLLYMDYFGWRESLAAV